MRSEVHIFRAGNYPQGTFTSKDVDEMADFYNALQVSPNPQDRKQAPLYFDHPKESSEQQNRRGPAAGYVVSLRADNGNLYAEVDWVPTQVHKVQSGEYKNRSVEIGRKPNGEWELTAVALLGAERPAVGGLDPIDFSRPFNSVFFAENFTTESPQGGDETSIKDGAKMTIKEVLETQNTTNSGANNTEVKPVVPTEFAEKKHLDPIQLQHAMQRLEARLSVFESENERLRRENESLQLNHSSAIFSENFAELRKLGLPNGMSEAVHTIYKLIPEKTVHFSENGEEKSADSRHIFFNVLRKIVREVSAIPHETLGGVTANVEKTAVFGEKRKKMQEEKEEKEKEKELSEISDDELGNQFAQFEEDYEDKNGKPPTAAARKEFMRKLMKEYNISEDQQNTYK
jgi:hypothetical protein